MNRLSKIQKWILITTYKKTILKDYELCELEYRSHWRFTPERIIEDDNFYWSMLFRAEILINYFKCESKKHSNLYPNVGLKIHHFKNVPNKYQATLTRTLKNLNEQGLIEMLENSGGDLMFKGICLTELGKDISLKLIEKHNVLL